MTHSYSIVSSAARGRIRASLLRLALSAGLVLLLAAMSFTDSSAQSTPLIHHSIVKLRDQPPPSGRDFWFSFMSNYWGVNLGGKYLRIYITSPSNTTAYIFSQGKTIPIPIVAYQVGTYICPEFWEMESSGIVESKAVHVWSNDADLTVYDMSRNSATSDGSRDIPTIGWGTDYVIGAYASLFEGGANYVYDLPSTMAVTADEDNTVVTITPSCDCRQCTGGNYNGDANSTIVVYPQGSPAQFTLNRGQDLELIPVKAQGPDGYDMTGTYVHSNQPVGVEGGSICPNIPDNFPYCDHVEEQMPPIRSWTETYIATNFEQPPGTPADHDFATYLFISSVPNQAIYRHDCTTGDHTECVIGSQYGVYWDQLELAQKFTSNEPFLCVEYINSATYPDNTNGLGDPAEAVVPPREQYTKTVVFETPVNTGGQYPDPYYNYANITVNINDVNKTFFDGTKISSHPGQCIDGNWEIIPITNISAGAHEITGDDSGVGVYVYGYGYDESYAWTGSFGSGSFHSPDTIPPAADTQGQCYAANVWVSDSTMEFNGVDIQSGLSEIALDSVYNMSYTPDVNFIPGSGQEVPGSPYSMYVINITKEAFLRIDVYDVAGNETIITSTYKPTFDSIQPPLQNLGSWITGPPNIAYDTLINNSEATVTINQLQLKYGNVGFSIYDSIGGPLDMSPLKPGQRRLIQIQFQAIQPTKVVDSIIFGAPCDPQAVAVIGIGGANDFLVTSQIWKNMTLPPPTPAQAPPIGGYVKTVNINNLSKGQIIIDSEWWSDTHFVALPGQLPDTVAGAGTKQFKIAYFPDNGSLTVPNQTEGNWTSLQVLENGVVAIRNDSLIGNAVAPTTTFGDDTTITINCAPPGDTIPIRFTLAATGTSASTIYRVTQSDTTDFLPLQGTLDNNNIPWNPANTSQTLPGNQTATITLRYPVPLDQNVSVVDYITAVTDSAGDQIGGRPLKVVININYYAYQTQPNPLIFPSVNYQGAPLTRTFVIQNTANSVLQLTSAALKGDSKYNLAYTVTSGLTLPDSLQPGQSDTVTVTFDPNISFDSIQNAVIDFVTNACNIVEEEVKNPVLVGGAATTPNAPVPILSCNTLTNNITVLNPKPQFLAPADTFQINDVVDTIISIGWDTDTGQSQYFSFNNDSGAQIQGTVVGQPTSNLAIPITFMPPDVPGTGLDTFFAVLRIEVRSNDNTDTVLFQTVKGIAGSVAITTTSLIANTTNAVYNDSGVAGNTMRLPANITNNLGGLTPTLTVDQLGITGAKLTYIIPERDLLTRQGGFNVDPALGWNSVLVHQTQAGPENGGSTADTIVYMLTGTTALSANNTSFGYLTFTVDLDQAIDATPVQLASVDLFTGANGDTPLGSCVASNVASGNFSLILACGDSTLRDMMNNEGANISFIGAATPDPVSSGNVTIKYANRGATNMTLAIYDVLGNEVARPVNNVYQDAGAWQVSCDVSKLPSGTYTYRLNGKNALNGESAISSQFVIQR